MLQATNMHCLRDMNVLFLIRKQAVQFSSCFSHNYVCYTFPLIFPGSKIENELMQKFAKHCIILCYAYCCQV